MEAYKVLIAVISITALSSFTHGAPSYGTASTAQVLINYVIPRRVESAIQEMKNVHQLIKSSKYIQDSLVKMPNLNAQSCSSTQELKDNLAIAYKKLLDFRSPLYMAFSYEEKQGHAHLAAIIKDTSYYLNGSIAVMQRLMTERQFPVPSVQSHSSEADLDQFCREYLQALVNNDLISLVITNDVVKIYRNYLIFYTLTAVNVEVSNCLSFK
ncbi:uncharacterized protein LOC122951297 [Acropora millepora]|uniref:uncharacterized protein LOC122951297 n=1 Tax=Acropora millepora TaxID=45264 RepID=UPI001CF12957|nr:uncharacterized protein LOC122951297 [Acropora millepora]